jgi:predicted RNA methylase
MQEQGLLRNTIDKFYTNSDVVDMCIDNFVDLIKPKQSDIIFEPSAGGGAFSNVLRKMFKNVIAIDIQPDHKTVKQEDFLEEFDEGKIMSNTVHVIGNPPFGRQSSLAKRFIKKSSSFAESISFILPKSFKKDSFQKSFPVKFHLIFCIDLPVNSFLINDKPHDVPCVFQIWRKKDEDRVVNKIEKPDFYDYVRKEENPDVSLRRVGVNSGEISKEISEKSTQSHYFLKLKDVDVDHFIKVYNEKKNFMFNNTVGPRSISKSEFDDFMNSLIDLL